MKRKNKPLPTRNPNLQYKGIRTWADWERHSQVFKVVVSKETNFFKEGQVFDVFQHPYDEKYYNLIVTGG